MEENRSITIEVASVIWNELGGPLVVQRYNHGYQFEAEA